MLNILCPTCEAKLIVKDEKLIGKILACPKCGSMVLIQYADEAPTPPGTVSPKPAVHKKFPSPLTHETASGVIGQVPEENRRTNLILEAVPESAVSETELKARKFLIGILIGLAILLLIALGFLMVSRKPTPQQPPPEQVPIAQEIPVEVPPVEPDLLAQADEVIDNPPPNEEPVNVLPQDIPVEPVVVHDEQNHVAPDTLSAFERAMPGFLDTSVPNIDTDTKLALPILRMNLDQQSLIGFVRVMSRLT